MESQAKQRALPAPPWVNCFDAYEIFQVRIHWHDFGKKVDGYYKIKSSSLKLDEFSGIENPSVF